MRATESDAHQAYAGHPGIIAPYGGETGYQIAARALPVVTRIVETYDAGDVLRRPHGGLDGATPLEKIRQYRVREPSAGGCLVEPAYQA